MKLSDFTMRIMRKNTENVTDIPLTISSKDGLINQNDFFNKQVASKDMSGYYLLHHGEYAYNKSYSVGYDFGSIKRLEKYDMGALSTLYICFALTKFNSDFIKHYFDSLKWYREIYMISAEGARNHGLLNVPTEEFFATLHTLPTDEAEQEKIASFLDALTGRIEKQRSLVENLKKYRRGLLSAVFSRKLTFGTCAEWHETTISECLQYEQPQKYIVKTEQYNDSYSTPVLTANKAFILGYTNESTGIYEKGDVIIYDDFTMDMKYVSFPFKVKSSTIKMLTPRQGFDLYFVYALLQSLELQPEGHQRSYISKVEPLVVKVPCYEEQVKISNFLQKCDSRVHQEEENLTKMIQYKNGLLQSLFT